MQRNRRPALLTLLGTGVLGLSCALAASAQDNTTPATPATPTVQQNQNTTDMSSDTSMRRHSRHMRDRDRNADDRAKNDMDEDDIDPMSIGYPFAAPGAINLYHFHTYRGLWLRSGSATDTRYRHERDRDEMRMKSTGNYRMDEDDIDPMPIGYPFAAPGAIDLYHFRSYEGLALDRGSATDTRYKAMRDQDKKRMQMMHNQDANGSGPMNSTGNSNP